jgi:MFS superfamily sulfate permease-like transporter
MQIGLTVLLADFLALTAYAFAQYGYVGFFQVLLDDAVGIQVTADLVIALSLVMLWMWRDARARGVSPLPFIVITLLVGSVGPLLYLIARAAERGVQPAALVRAA